MLTIKKTETCYQVVTPSGKVILDFITDPRIAQNMCAGLNIAVEETTLELCTAARMARELLDDITVATVKDIVTVRQALDKALDSKPKAKNRVARNWPVHISGLEQ